ncbi:hypothetical protein [Candidatus Methylocalor cossyra]|uniref:Transposase n=1 Tax=Candidatus Methylocalor cossyra TaxID=3108543 RepID=A0ABP1CCW7_9GAMM
MAQPRADVAATEIQLRSLQRQIDTASDIKSLKAWLKTVTQRPPDRDFDLRF